MVSVSKNTPHRSYKIGLRSLITCCINIILSFDNCNWDELDLQTFFHSINQNKSEIVYGSICSVSIPPAYVSMWWLLLFLELQLWDINKQVVYLLSKVSPPATPVTDLCRRFISKNKFMHQQPGYVCFQNVPRFQLNLAAEYVGISGKSVLLPDLMTNTKKEWARLGVSVALNHMIQPGFNPITFMTLNFDLKALYIKSIWHAVIIFHSFYFTTDNCRVRNLFSKPRLGHFFPWMYKEIKGVMQVQSSKYPHLDLDLNLK